MIMKSSICVKFRLARINKMILSLLFIHSNVLSWQESLGKVSVCYVGGSRISTSSERDAKFGKHSKLFACISQKTLTKSGYLISAMRSSFIKKCAMILEGV